MAFDYPDEWEYRAVRPPRESTKKEASDPTDQLNDLGSDGWRLAETVDYVDGGTKYLLMERPVGMGSDSESDSDAASGSGDGDE